MCWIIDDRMRMKQLDIKVSYVIDPTVFRILNYTIFHANVNVLNRGMCKAAIDILCPTWESHGSLGRGDYVVQSSGLPQRTPYRIPRTLLWTPVCTTTHINPTCPSYPTVLHRIVLWTPMCTTTHINPTCPSYPTVLHRIHTIASWLYHVPTCNLSACMVHYLEVTLHVYTFY